MAKQLLDTPVRVAIGSIGEVARLQLGEISMATVLGGAFGVLNVIPFRYQDRRNGPTHQSDGRLALDAAWTLRALR